MQKELFPKLITDKFFMDASMGADRKERNAGVKSICSSELWAVLDSGFLPPERHTHRLTLPLCSSQSAVVTNTLSQAT